VQFLESLSPFLTLLNKIYKDREGERGREGESRKESNKESRKERGERR
jgi:hypothetical protein